MHDVQHLATVRHDLAAVEAYAAKLAIEANHAQHALDELLRRLATIEALRDRLRAERAATDRAVKRERRRAANVKKWRESVPR